MKDEKEILRTTDKSIHVMEDFDPSLLENVAAPVVSLYIPVHHDEREERRDLWDADMFKDLMKGRLSHAFRALSRRKLQGHPQ